MLIFGNAEGVFIYIVGKLFKKIRGFYHDTDLIK